MKKRYVLTALLCITYTNSSLQAQQGVVAKPNVMPAAPAVTTPIKSDMTSNNVLAGSSIVIKIADPYKIISGLDESAEQMAKIKKEIDARARSIEDMKTALMKKSSELQSSTNLMTATAKETAIEELRRLQSDIEFKQQSLQEYAERTAQEAQMNIFKKIEAASRAYAQENKIDIILGGSIIYANPQLDVSADIITRMNQEHKKSKAPEPKKETVAPKSKL